MDTALQFSIEIEDFYESEEKNKEPFNLIYFGSENLIINEVKKILFSTIHIFRKVVYEKLKNTNSFIPLFNPKSIVLILTTLKTNVLIAISEIINVISILCIEFIINKVVFVEHECRIGNFAYIDNGAILAGNVVIREYSFLRLYVIVYGRVTINDNVIECKVSDIINKIPSNSIFVENPARNLIK